MAPTAGTPPPTTVVDPGHAEPLDALLDRSGVPFDDNQRRQLAGYRDLLYHANQTTNLTAVRDPAGIERRLIIESLRLVAPIRDLPPGQGNDHRSLLDLGTGGGLPGMVLAIACPDYRIFLLDATGKKVEFLGRVVETLGLGNATPIHARAEELAHQPRYRNAFDVVTARAVSSLPALLELGLPLLRVHGHLVLPKGTDIGDELAAGGRAATMLGGTVVSSDLLPGSDSAIETRLVIARKTAPTPTAYPRRSGLPSRSPLGSEAPSRSRAHRKGGDP